jgi:hypothetical protein
LLTLTILANRAIDESILQKMLKLNRFHASPAIVLDAINMAEVFPSKAGIHDTCRAHADFLHRHSAASMDAPQRESEAIESVMSSFKVFCQDLLSFSSSTTSPVAQYLQEYIDMIGCVGVPHSASSSEVPSERCQSCLVYIALETKNPYKIAVILETVKDYYTAQESVMGNPSSLPPMKAVLALRSSENSSIDMNTTATATEPHAMIRSPPEDILLYSCLFNSIDCIETFITIYAKSYNNDVNRRFQESKSAPSSHDHDREEFISHLICSRKHFSAIQKESSPIDIAIWTHNAALVRFLCGNYHVIISR